MAFQIECKPQEEILLFVLHGDLDITSSPELKKYVLEAYRKNPSDVRFDLSALDYVDSTGLGVFISIYKNLKEDDHRLHIAHGKEHVRKLFRITELDRLFVMED